MLLDYVNGTRPKTCHNRQHHRRRSGRVVGVQARCRVAPEAWTRRAGAGRPLGLPAAAARRGSCGPRGSSRTCYAAYDYWSMCGPDGTLLRAGLAWDFIEPHGPCSAASDPRGTLQSTSWDSTEVLLGFYRGPTRIFYSDPRPAPGRSFLAPRAPGAPAPLPTLWETAADRQHLIQQHLILEGLYIALHGSQQQT
jgi:hypothetical protein